MPSPIQWLALTFGALLIAASIWFTATYWLAWQPFNGELSAETSGVAEGIPAGLNNSSADQTTIYSSSQIKTLVVGYCPTMSDAAAAIELAANGSASLKQESSTAATLADLEHGVIDAALVGRPARRSELGFGFTEIRIEEGHTLVAAEPRTIQYDAIPSLTIHTYESARAAAQLLPNGTNAVVHATLEQALLASKDAALIDWRDYRESMGLVTVLNSDGTKARDFRAAVLYFPEDGIENALDAFRLNRRN